MTKQQVIQKLNHMEFEIHRIVECMELDMTILKKMLEIMYEETINGLNNTNKK